MGSDSFSLARRIATAGLAIGLLAVAGDATEAAAEGVWVSAAELSAKPMSGSAWEAVLAAADGSLGTPGVGDYNSLHDTRTLAVALVYARTGDAIYRTKARDAILSAIGTESTTVQAVQPCLSSA